MQRKKTQPKKSQHDKRIPPRILPVFGEESSADFLVYVAAILRYEPIFIQSLGFIFRTTGAVEQLYGDTEMDDRFDY